MTRVLVTGGTGFLGRAVIDALLAGGHEVRVATRDARARLPREAEPVVASFSDPQSLSAALGGVEAILHLAGKVSRDPDDASEMHAIHVEGTTTLLRAARDAGVRRFVLASTSGTIAVSSTRRRDATEADEAPLEVIGRWPYYLSKRLQEQEVLRWDARDEVEAVILNPSLLLGPNDERLSSTADVLNILNRRLPAVTDGTVAFVDVRDAAGAFVAALERGRRGHRYLLNGANMSVAAFAERVALAGGVAPPRLKLPGRWAIGGARLVHGLYYAVQRDPPVDVTSVDISNHHWNCDASKAGKELGFSARDPQVTILDTVRYLRERRVFRAPS